MNVAALQQASLGEIGCIVAVHYRYLSNPAMRFLHDALITPAGGGFLTR